MISSLKAILLYVVDLVHHFNIEVNSNVASLLLYDIVNINGMVLLAPIGNWEKENGRRGYYQGQTQCSCSWRGKVFHLTLHYIWPNAQLVAFFFITSKHFRWLEFDVPCVVENWTRRGSHWSSSYSRRTKIGKPLVTLETNNFFNKYCYCNGL